eukprot:3071005-Alexandrium_andersonii.AAC.1
MPQQCPGLVGEPHSPILLDAVVGELPAGEGQDRERVLRFRLTSGHAKRRCDLEFLDECHRMASMGWNYRSNTYTTVLVWAPMPQLDPVG